MKLKQIFISLLASIVIICAGTSISTALDTDIYFLDPSAGGIVKPNLLLVIDTSGSMASSVSGTTLMRLDVMKNALLSVVDDLENTNAGLMRFGHSRAGPVMFPVKNLDTTINDLATADATFNDDKDKVQILVQDSPDDAEEPVSGTTNITATTLNLNSSTTGGTESVVGVRFRNTFIPRGVTITSAKIVFLASSTDTGNSSLTITADQTTEAPPYTATTNNIGGRTQTTAAVDWNITSDWTAGEFYESQDISTIVQEVVGQTDWCYGSSMAFKLKRKTGTSNTSRRRARAYDSYYENANVGLIVTYDATTIPATNTCRQISVRVKTRNEDAEEASSGTMTIDSSTNTAANVLELGTSKYVGLRFNEVKVPLNATIKSAFLEFEVNAAISSGSTTASFTIAGQDIGNAPVFTGTNADISSRTLVPTTVSWPSVPNSAANQRLVSPDIKGIIQPIVNNVAWTEGSALMLRVEGSGQRNVEAFDREAAGAALLRIRYVADIPFRKTVRDRLKELVVGMRIASGTPIVDALYEGAIYYRGNAAVRGKDRGITGGGIGTSTTDERRWARVSHPGSYSGGTLNTPAGCTAADPDSASCRTETITGSATYRSPIAYECQSNHMVLLTDGAATQNNSASAAPADGVPKLTGISSCATTYTMNNTTTYNLSSNERCGIDLANFLFQTDQTTAFGGLQNVKTHTIGLNIANGFLEGLAKNGGGIYRSANDAEQLASAFSDILNEVLDYPTSFVSPSLSVNAFNRLYSRDEVYFTLFTPQTSTQWPGNVKKYTLCVAPPCIFGEVLDATNASAIDPSNSKIKGTATSGWNSPAGDGPLVEVGGAGSKITDYSTRRVYTYTGTNVDLTHTSNAVVTTNAAITQAMLGAASTTERDNIIDWMRGKDLTTGTTRWSFADALHSRPATIGYGGTVANPVIKLVVGTNDGGVRMIDAASGQEDWIIYLPEFLIKQKDILANAEGSHIVGVDGSSTLRIQDINNDGIINPVAGDKVHMFIGMRRGTDISGIGYIYAFDLTPDTTTGALTTSSAIGALKPKFMWKISSATTGFGALGQTWSQPLLTKVYVKCPTGDTSCQSGVSGQKDSKVRTVLMFGGGYDPAFDSKLGGTGESMGNAIFMVDPDTGSRLWWAGGPSSGADLVESDMKYSIPSDLALFDSDRDGVTDRIYVGDVHGQLWRIDLSNQIDPNASSATNRNDGANTDGYVFADIGCGNTVDNDVGTRSSNCSATTNQNRLGFFYPPDVAQVEDETYASTGNTIYDYVTIGTGDREDPLDKKTQAVSQEPVHNRIYAFRDPNTKLGKPATTPSAITETNLHNADANALSNPSGPSYSAALSDIKSAKGWFINLKEATPPNWIGEKVLARTTVFAGVLFANTYTPPQSGGTPTACGDPAEGKAKAYELNLLNASGVYTSSGDRSDKIGGGIPSELVIVIRETGTSSLIGTSSGAKPKKLPPQTPRRTYWYQE